MEAKDIRECFRFMVWAIYDTVDLESQAKEDRFDVPVMPYTHRRLVTLVKFVVNNPGIDYGKELREITAEYEEKYIMCRPLMHKGPYTSTTIFGDYWMYEIAELLGLGFDRNESYADYVRQAYANKLKDDGTTVQPSRTKAAIFIDTPKEKFNGFDESDPRYELWCNHPEYFDEHGRIKIEYSCVSMDGLRKKE